MLSARDINDRLLRLELAMSNIADELIGLHALFAKVRDDMNALRMHRMEEEDYDAECE